jgi:hypothetical protein
MTFAIKMKTKLIRLAEILAMNMCYLTKVYFGHFSCSFFVKSTKLRKLAALLLSGKSLKPLLLGPPDGDRNQLKPADPRNVLRFNQKDGQRKISRMYVNLK